MRVRIELLWLRLALYILQGCNVTRSQYTSRRNNNDLWYLGDKLIYIMDSIKEKNHDK